MSCKNLEPSISWNYVQNIHTDEKAYNVQELYDMQWCRACNERLVCKVLSILENKVTYRFYE